MYVGMDLDGTLLNSRKKIDDLTIETIRLLKKKNVHFFLATGRHFYETRKYITLLGLSEGDYVISCDGMYTHDSIGNLVWSAKQLSAGDVQQIQRVASLSRMLVFDGQWDYLIQKSLVKRFVSYIRKILLSQKRVRICSEPVFEENLTFEKIRIRKEQISPETQEALSKSYHLCCIDGQFVDITPYGTSKYSAICRLAGHLEIDSENILYFGDDENDLECFLHLKYCIAPSNAIAAIKQHAYQITDSNEDGGVGVALRDFYSSWV